MSITYFGSFDAECLSLAVDAFAAGALRVDGMVERARAIEQHAHQPAFLPIRVFDAAFAFGELGMRTGLARACRKEQGAAKALGAKAIGVLKLVRGMHTQARPAAWGAIGVAWHLFMPMIVEGNGGDAPPVGHRLIDIPIVKGSIGGHIGGELVGGNHDALVEWAVIRDIGFIERQGVLGQHHIAIDGISSSRHARAIAPDVFLFFFAGLRFFRCVLVQRLFALVCFAGLRLCLSGWLLWLAGLVRCVLIGTPFDAQFAIGIAGQSLRFVVAVFDVDALVILFD